MAAVDIHPLNSGVSLAFLITELNKCKLVCMAQPQNSLGNPHFLGESH